MCLLVLALHHPPFLKFFYSSIYHLSILFLSPPFTKSFLPSCTPFIYGPLLTVTGGLVDGDKIEVLPERVERLASRLKVQCSTILYCHAILSHAMPCHAMPYHSTPCFDLFYHFRYPTRFHTTPLSTSTSTSTTIPDSNLIPNLPHNHSVMSVCWTFLMQTTSHINIHSLTHSLTHSLSHSLTHFIFNIFAAIPITFFLFLFLFLFLSLIAFRHGSNYGKPKPGTAK